MEQDDALDAAAYAMGFTAPKEEVDLSLESLSDAVEKIRVMRDVGMLEAAPSVVLGTVSQAAALAGAYNIGTASNGSASSISDWDRNVKDALLKTVRPFEVQPDMTMLEDASSPYNTDPETLSNLWVVRFGKGWVGSEAVEDMDAEENNWWRHAANRLRELGYLEMHTLASSYRVVLRIVE